MDFKVAGTADAITALQLDTKIEGIPADVLAAALNQARDARLAILDVMATALSAPRPEVSATAPKIVSFKIPLDKVGEVIGPKGKIINTIQQETGADIAIDDDGVNGIVSIGSPDGLKVAAARARIEALVSPPLAEIGKTDLGTVVNITKFGAFVNILPGRDGLVHISKLGRGKRIAQVEDVVQLGDQIEVVVEDIDDKGKVSLTPAGDGPDVSETAASAAPARASAPVADAGPAPVAVSFEDVFDDEIRSELGDLGPASATTPADRGNRDADRRAPRRRR